MVDLKDKVVVITGASSGIGKATAIAFARKGCKVVLAARRVEKLKKLKAEISPFNKNCWYVQTDVTREKEVRRLFDEAERIYGRVDMVINSAGKGCEVAVCDLSYDAWLSVMSTNLTSVFLCTREAVRRMIQKATKGHIITISSIAGLYGVPTYAAYAASKHGVTGFMRSIRGELRKHSIKVSTIYPANVDTEFFDHFMRKPRRGELLPAHDIANYLLAIASRSLPRIVALRLILICKRMYYLAREVLLP